MKTKNILIALIITMSIVSCHGTSSKDYDKKEKNDPGKIEVPSNSDATMSTRITRGETPK